MRESHFDGSEKTDGWTLVAIRIVQLAGCSEIVENFFWSSARPRYAKKNAEDGDGVERQL